MSQHPRDLSLTEARALVARAVDKAEQLGLRGGLAVVGANGTGKSHLLRLLAAGGTDPDLEHVPVTDDVPDPVVHTGTARLGARVRPGWFRQSATVEQLPAHLRGRTLLEVLHRGDGHRPGRGRAMPRLKIILIRHLARCCNAF